MSKGGAGVSLISERNTRAETHPRRGNQTFPIYLGGANRSTFPVSAAAANAVEH